MLVVANKADANVSVLELPGGRVLATLPTGVGPHEVAISPDGRRAVVSNYGDKDVLGRSLTVIDLARLEVTGTIDLGEYRRPHGAAWFPDGKRVLVTAEVNASVVVVDVDGARVERGVFTSQQGSHMLMMTRDGKRAYVANMGSGTVTGIDLVTMTAAEPVPAIEACEAIAVTPDGSEVWTASLAKDQVVVLDAARQSSPPPPSPPPQQGQPPPSPQRLQGRPPLVQDTQIPALGAPIRIVPTPDGKSMLVTNAKASALQIVDVATRAVRTVTFEPSSGDAASGGSAVPVGTVVSSDGSTAYVALVAEDRVAVVDLETASVSGYLTVGRGPDGLGYSSAFVVAR